MKASVLNAMLLTIYALWTATLTLTPSRRIYFTAAIFKDSYFNDGNTGGCYFTVDIFEEASNFNIDIFEEASDFNKDYEEDCYCNVDHFKSGCHFNDGNAGGSYFNDDQGVGAYQEASTKYRWRSRPSYSHVRTGEKVGSNCTPKVQVKPSPRRLRSRTGRAP